MLFKEPELTAGGATALGGALHVLADCIRTEVRTSTATQKGDWKPLVFLLTDGAPTDNLDEGIEALKSVSTGNIIACAAGANANTNTLRKITNNVLMMTTSPPATSRRSSRGCPAPDKGVSKSIDAKPGEAIQLPPPPQGFVIVP